MLSLFFDSVIFDRYVVGYTLFSICYGNYFRIPYLTRFLQIFIFFHIKFFILKTETKKIEIIIPMNMFLTFSTSSSS